MAMLKEGSVGRWGEDTAADYLVGLGYALKARNWKMDHYEVDIVMQDGTSIVFVEVKARKNPNDDPVKAVNKSKRAKLIASANAFMQHFEIPLEYRFDIVAISGEKDNPQIVHIPDAFFPSLTRFNYSFKL